MEAETKKRSCVVCDSETDGWICRRDWNALPIDMRRRWWVETSYGNKDPSSELIEQVKTLLLNRGER